MLRVEHFFSKRGWLNYLLLPLALSFQLVVSIRRLVYETCRRKIGGPVIIVIGNVSVGGSGKTPTVIAIANYLCSRGYRVGVISRGYRGQNNQHPQVVTSQSKPEDVGDEPVLIAKSLINTPVVICRNRRAAFQSLVKKFSCDIVLSDDGLQHYRLQRDIEIVCLNKRAIGNRFCLPSGPLREPLSRLKQVDFVLSDEESAFDATIKKVRTVDLYHLLSGKEVSAQTLSNQSVVAISGIAHPERFHQSLSAFGIIFKSRVFPDHHLFKSSDFDDKSLFVMTEKDAVKCQYFNKDNLYYLKIDVCIPKKILDRLDDKIKQRIKEKNATKTW